MMWMPMERRYQNDAHFRALVDMLQSYLEQYTPGITPTELREAVMLAAIMFEYRHVRPLVLSKDGPFKEASIQVNPQRKRVVIKDGWDGAGREGYKIGEDVLVGGQMWAPVLWEDEEDPDWHKSAGLQEARL